MFAINNLLPSSTSNQQADCIGPHELKIKIFNSLPIKTLAISRLVSSIWKIFVDTYFPEFFAHQFLFILQKYPIADQIDKNSYFRFTIKKIAVNNFEKALELSGNLEGHHLTHWQMRTDFDDLVENADSKEKILTLFDLFLKKQDLFLPLNFFSSIQPLIKRYFSIHAAEKKEKEEAVAGNFNEALSILNKFQFHRDVHLLIGLSLVETYPEYAKNQQNAIFDSLKLDDNCFHYVEITKIVEQFSFLTLLNLLVIAKFFPEKYQKIPYFFNRIKTREDALAYLAIGGKSVQESIKSRGVYKHLNFFDLLRGAALLPEEIETYQFYRKILKRAESVGEFEIGMQKFLERKPAENLKYHQALVSIILDETSTHLLSFGVYEMLLHYPDKAFQNFLKAFLRIAFKCEKRLCKTIVDRVKRVQKLDDHRLCDIMALEIGMGEFEQAKQTFCSIKHPTIKGKGAAQFNIFIEKEDWDHFDAFFKEFHPFLSLESANTDIFLDLIYQMAKKDVKRALNLARSYSTDYVLAYGLLFIAKQQKKQKANFLPLVFEARSLILSLVTPNENAGQALHLLKELLELQSENET